MYKLITALALTLLTGCAITPIDQNNVKTLTTLEICRSAKDERRAPHLRQMIFDEIKGRGIASDKDIAHINTQKVFIGMTDCGLIMSKGLPNELFACGDINVTNYEGGVSMQYVYRDCSGILKDTYIYTDNGFVTAIQN